MTAKTADAIKAKLKRGFCKDELSVDKHGHFVAADNARAVRWCVQGAAVAVLGSRNAWFELDVASVLHSGKIAVELNNHPSTTVKTMCEVVDLCVPARRAAWLKKRKGKK